MLYMMCNSRFAQEEIAPHVAEMDRTSVMNQVVEQLALATCRLATRLVLAGSRSATVSRCVLNNVSATARGGGSCTWAAHLWRGRNVWPKGVGGGRGMLVGPAACDSAVATLDRWRRVPCGAALRRTRQGIIQGLFDNGLMGIEIPEEYGACFSSLPPCVLLARRSARAPQGRVAAVHDAESSCELRRAFAWSSSCAQHVFRLTLLLWRRWCCTGYV